MKPRSRRAMLLSAAVVGWALISAQATAFQHDLDLGSHPADQVCTICVASAGLGGANVGQPLLISFSSAVSTLPDYQRPAHSPELSKGHLARAPPTVS